MTNFTLTEKIDCIQREIKFREKVYPRLISAGKMTQEKANREISIMQEILIDYKSKVPVVQKKLF